MFGSYLRPLPPILNLANYPCHLLAILSWYGLARSAMVALRIVWSTLPKRLDVHKRLQKWPRPGKSGGREYYLVFRAINFPFDLGVSTWFVAATAEDGTTRVLCAIYSWITPGFWEASRWHNSKSRATYFQPGVYRTWHALGGRAHCRAHPCPLF